MLRYARQIDSGLTGHNLEPVAKSPQDANRQAQCMWKLSRLSDGKCTLTPVSLTPVSDPFGKYFCKQSGGCPEFDKAYDDIKQASAHYSPDSAIGKAFAKVLGYYGDKGEKGAQGNVIDIKEGKTSTGNPAEISHNAFTGSDTITFDVKQILDEDNGSGAELAASAAHEGQHGVDDATRRENHMSETLDTVNATEHSAYTLQSYVNQGLGVNSVYGLWRSDWPASEVEAKRAAAVDKYSELSVHAWQKQH
jgi:hypothetical protein